MEILAPLKVLAKMGQELDVSHRVIYAALAHSPEATFDMAVCMFLQILPLPGFSVLIIFLFFFVFCFFGFIILYRDCIYYMYHALREVIIGEEGVITARDTALQR
jgi:hypothetical protein